MTVKIMQIFSIGIMVLMFLFSMFSDKANDFFYTKEGFMMMILLMILLIFSIVSFRIEKKLFPEKFKIDREKAFSGDPVNRFFGRDRMLLNIWEVGEDRRKRRREYLKNIKNLKPREKFLFYFRMALALMMLGATAVVGLYSIMKDYLNY